MLNYRLCAFRWRADRHVFYVGDNGGTAQEGAWLGMTEVYNWGDARALFVRGDS